jgi:hypothetical protein
MAPSIFYVHNVIKAQRFFTPPSSPLPLPTGRQACEKGRGEGNLPPFLIELKNGLVSSFDLIYDRVELNHDIRGEYNENEND